MILLRRNHLLFKLSAGLLMAACMLCVLFGYGTHLHIAFDHGEIHANLHAHSNSFPSQSELEHNHVEHDSNHIQISYNGDGSTHSQTSAHQHHTATVDLTGTLTQSTPATFNVQTNLIYAPAVLAGLFDVHILSVWYLDLPPPDLPGNSDAFSSFSLRGPPRV